MVTHLIRKPLIPPIQILNLLRPQILTIIQRALQILRQHLLIKALTRQSPRRIPPREILIRAPRSIEVASGAHVEDLTADGEEDRRAVLAIEGEEGAWRVGLEDDGRRGLRKGLRRRRAEAVVDQDGEEGEENEVDGGGDGGSDTRVCVSNGGQGAECEGQGVGYSHLSRGGWTGGFCCGGLACKVSWESGDLLSLMFPTMFE